MQRWNCLMSNLMLHYISRKKIVSSYGVGEILAPTFPEILATISEVLASHRPEALADLDAALEWDRWGRQRAGEVLSKRRRAR